ncbi:uncharacterized protein METZ01_LOCUS492682 [marine metagenome]|uniref:Uncharacterized protein n=1 Tax=marine metagenome TaxID=408172 RepID=A0A383D7J4_9ZZZZ
MLTGPTRDVPMQIKPVLLIYALNYTGAMTILSTTIIEK